MRCFLRSWSLAGLLAGSLLNARAAEPLADFSSAWNPCDNVACAPLRETPWQELAQDEPL